MSDVQASDEISSVTCLQRTGDARVNDECYRKIFGGLYWIYWRHVSSVYHACSTHIRNCDNNAAVLCCVIHFDMKLHAT